MIVARDQRVDAINSGQNDRSILHPVRMIGLTNPRMRQRYDQIAALFLHLGHIGLRGLNDITRLDIALKVLAIPVHDLRRGKADHPDLDRMLGAVTHFDLAIQDRVGFHQGLVIARVCAFFLRDIGQNNRELGTGQSFIQKLQPVVKLMISQRRSVIANRVEGCDYRMAVALVHAAFIGDVVTHRIALQKVAIVDQQRIRRLGPDLIDDRRGAGQANRIAGFVRVIVVGEDMDVDVRGFHDPQMRLVARCSSRERVQRNGRNTCCCRGEELAARNLIAAGERHRSPFEFVNQRAFSELLTTRV